MTERFQRARTEEQRAARRAAILDVTRRLVEQRGVAEVSLNEIAREVGLAKSNVLRYFESREAILLTLLHVEYNAWADELSAAIRSRAGDPGESSEEVTARTVAATIMSRPLLCDLLAAAPTVLEHNLSAEVARAYRRTMVGTSTRLLAAVSPTLGELDRDRARGFLIALHAFVVMVWNAKRPSPGMARALAEDPELKNFRMGPEEALAEFLATFLVGLHTRPPQLDGLPGGTVESADGPGQPG